METDNGLAVLIGNVAAVSLLISVWMHLHYRLYRLSATQARIGFGLMMGSQRFFPCSCQ
jgi:hypothetical protein